MKIIVWFIALSVVVGFFLSAYGQKEARRDFERKESEQIVQATKTDVSLLASRMNAVMDWEASLCAGDSYRYEPVLTIELERLWLQERPIIFFGAIKDISTHKESKYLVSVEKSDFSSFDYYDTQLELSLVSDKLIVDAFLEEHPDLVTAYENGVAVVARITSIETRDVPGEEGWREHLKTGHGELLSIVRTNDVAF